MFNTALTKRVPSLGMVALLLIASASWGQSAPAGLRAKFSPGTSSHFEFEGQVHIQTEHASNVRWKVPSDCSYQIRAVLKFDFTALSAEGTLSGRVSYHGVDAQIPECAMSSRERVTAAVKEIESNGAEFQIFPAGDVRVSKIAGDDEPEVVAILRKGAWDLLQPRLTDTALAPGSAWSASRRFLFWPDTFVDGLDVAATSMHYARDVQIGAGNFALLDYKQVFSPADIPAYVEVRTRARDFTGTTLVAGRSGVSLLWSPDAQRVVYLHRQRTIDNRFMLKYDRADQQSGIARFLMQEESTLRWLPEKDSAAWLAELHHYEASAGETVPAPAKVQQAEAAEHRELSDLMERPPRGFERWRKTFCSGSFCFELSVAVPEGTKVAYSTGMTVLMLAGSDKRTMMLSVGPMFDLQCACLTDDELLQQQTLRFVGNHLWFGRSTGESLHFYSGSVHDRPAGFSEFSSKSRDLTPIHGEVVMVMGPFDRLVPVACAYDEDQSDLDSACQVVTQSVIVR